MYVEFKCCIEDSMDKQLLKKGGSSETQNRKSRSLK
jgi:hypothetical protein